MTPPDVIRAAKAAFDAYCGRRGAEDPDDFVEMSPALPHPYLSALQADLARWQNLQFGAQPDWTFALGAAEEVGELAHAVVKHSQGIRGMADREAYRGAAGDAVADAMIYLVQMATALRLDVGTLLELTAREVMRRDWRSDREGGGTSSSG